MKGWRASESIHTRGVFQTSACRNMVQERTSVIPGQPHLIYVLGLLLMYGELDHCKDKLYSRQEKD